MTLLGLSLILLFTFSWIANGAEKRKTVYEATVECNLCEASFKAGVTACWLRNAGLIQPPTTVTNIGQLQDWLWHEQTNGLANIK